MRSPHARTPWRAAALVFLAVVASCRTNTQDPAPGGVQRVVCLTPSSTEIVAAIGGVSTLVGVDKYSNHPPEVAALPRVGDFLNPDLEAILRLHPDLVVLDAVQEEAAHSLRSLGITTLVLQMHTVSDARSAIERVGAAMNQTARARQVITKLDQDLAAVAERISAHGSRPRVLAIVDRESGGLGSIVAAGKGSYLDELIVLAGGSNVLADAIARYPKLSPEKVIRLAPEVILDSVDSTADWTGLAVPAVATHRIRTLDPMFRSPGPRAGEAVQQLERLLEP